MRKFSVLLGVEQGKLIEFKHLRYRAIDPPMLASAATGHSRDRCARAAAPAWRIARKG